jgi:hypothetical protein
MCTTCSDRGWKIMCFNFGVCKGTAQLKAEPCLTKLHLGRRMVRSYRRPLLGAIREMQVVKGRRCHQRKSFSAQGLQPRRITVSKFCTVDPNGRGVSGPQMPIRPACGSDELN